MNDQLKEKIQNYIHYYNQHKPNANEHLKNLMLEDMFEILQEIIK